jgi:DNA-binding GntR family transcriptional regulator
VSRETNLSSIRLEPELRERRITADYIAEALREAINRGELADGAVLSQAALATHFGVSRVPVREAMRELQAEGLIETRAHRIAVVRELDIARILEIYTLRGLIEGWLIEQATPQIDAVTLARARALHEEIRAEDDHARWLGLNARFHRVLYEPSGLVTTLELLDGLRSRAERYARLWSRGPGIHRPDETSQEHARILELVEAGDAAGAREAVQQHILHTRDRVIAYGEGRAAEMQADEAAAAAPPDAP